MWFAGLALLPDWFVANVGVVVWQPLQSPEVGWPLSYAVGRESPQAAAVPTIIPRYGAVSWQPWHPLTPALATEVCPATLSVGFARLAAPILNPPAAPPFVTWQPDLLQSA